MTSTKKNIAPVAPSTAALALARATDTDTLCMIADGRIVADFDILNAVRAVLHERGETLASMLARLAR